MGEAMQEKRKKKSGSQRFYVLRSLGRFSLATRNSYFKVLVFYTLYQKSFLCILPMFIFILHIPKHWIQPDPGESNIHSSVGLWLLSLGPISEDTHNQGLQDTSPPA